MNLKFGIICVILLFLFLKSNAQMLIDHRCDEFIFIEHIPRSKKVLKKDLSIKDQTNGNATKLSKVRFMKALNKSKALKCSDKILFDWQYSSWVDITFLTSEGKYEIQLFLGGLGIMTLPNGKKGAVLFDF